MRSEKAMVFVTRDFRHQTMLYTIPSLLWRGLRVNDRRKLNGRNATCINH